MHSRLSAPWAALVVVLVAALAYSVGAQTALVPSANRLVVKAVPEGKEIRSFFIEVQTPPLPGPGPEQTVFTVPADKVFVLTDVVFPSSAWATPLTFYENSTSGPKRAFFSPTLSGSGPLGANEGHYKLASGVRFEPGGAVVVRMGGGTTGAIFYFTLSAYLADAY